MRPYVSHASAGSSTDWLARAGPARAPSRSPCAKRRFERAGAGLAHLVIAAAAASKACCASPNRKIHERIALRAARACPGTVAPTSLHRSAPAPPACPCASAEADLDFGPSLVYAAFDSAEFLLGTARPPPATRPRQAAGAHVEVGLRGAFQVGRGAKFEWLTLQCRVEGTLELVNGRRGSRALLPTRRCQFPPGRTPPGLARYSNALNTVA